MKKFKLFTGSIVEAEKPSQALAPWMQEGDRVLTFDDCETFHVVNENDEQTDAYCLEVKNEKKEVPEEARHSMFGCGNCLWNSIECKHGSKYQPKENEVLCATYTYFD